MGLNYTAPLARLIEEFQKLPGVGPKSAQRLAFHMLRQPSEAITMFSQALLNAKEQIVFCPVCFNLSSRTPCEICAQPQRGQDATLICVIADPKDLFALERTNEYRGSYHVLHGMISPLEGIGPEDLKIRELMARLAERPVTDNVLEVILALPPSIEGDTTSLYLSRLLKPLGVKLTRIAFGLPVGGDLEYADTLTITRALQGRQEMG